MTGDRRLRHWRLDPWLYRWNGRGCTPLATWLVRGLLRPAPGRLHTHLGRETRDTLPVALRAIIRIVCLRQTRATELRSALKAREIGGLSRMLVTFHLLLPLLSFNYMLTKSSRQSYSALPSGTALAHARLPARAFVSATTSQTRNRCNLLRGTTYSMSRVPRSSRCRKLPFGLRRSRIIERIRPGLSLPL